MRIGYRVIVGAVAAAALVSACTDETPDYLGGPAGGAARLSLLSTKIDIVVGDSVAIGGAVSDGVGNLTADAVTFTSCDGSVVAVVGAAAAAGPPWTSEAYAKGAGLGNSCIVASGGGFSDTISVKTGPAGLRIAGSDTLGSGDAAEYTVTAVDAAGNALTGTAEYAWSSSNTARMVVNGASGEARGRGVGAVTLFVRAPGGGNGTKALVVAPGVFAGALSKTSAAPGEVITATKAADASSFDGDEVVRLGGVTAFVDLVTASEVIFAVPAIGVTTASVLAFSNIGPDQLAQNTTLTPTKAAADVYQPGNITNDCSDPGTSVDWNAVKSPGGWVYLTHNGTSQGTRGCQNSGAVTGYDHYFVYTTGASAENVDVLAYWTASGDNDIIICATDYSSCPGFGFSGGALNELDAVDVDLAANTSYFIIYSPWTANTATNNIKIIVKKN